MPWLPESWPGVFGIMLSIQLVTGLLVGGSASLLGPLTGGVVLVLLPEFAFKLTRGTGANMFYGAALILIVFLLPSGIAGGLAALIGRLRERRGEETQRPSSSDTAEASPPSAGSSSMSTRA